MRKPSQRWTFAREARKAWRGTRIMRPDSYATLVRDTKVKGITEVAVTIQCEGVTVVIQPCEIDNMLAILGCAKQDMINQQKMLKQRK